MLSKNHSQKRKYIGEHAQAIVEFAIVLPILMMLLVGILEVGRMIFIYAAVNNASREAVRYASAYGLNNDGSANKYNDCVGIRDMAARSAFFTPLTVNMYYDQGLSSANPPVPIGQTSYCPTGTNVANIPVSSGYRITAEVSATYSPMVRLVPIRPRTFTSTSSRTILGILELAYP
jgi:Flp pilus assembly protein TadG